MNRIEFMNRLEQLLRSLPEEERSDALKYYNDYFDDAGPEREQEIIRELISPEYVARTIMGEMNQNSQNDWSGNMNQSAYRNGWNGQQVGNGGVYSDGRQSQTSASAKMPVWAWVLLIVTLPVTVPMALAVAGTLVGVFFGVFGTVIGFFFGSIGLFIGAIVLFATGFPGLGCLCLGIGALFECVVFLLIPFVLWLFRSAIPEVCRFIRKQICRLSRKGGNAA